MRKIWLLFVLTLVTGCSMIEQGPTSSSSMYADFETRTLDNPRLGEFIEARLHRQISPWPPESWDLTTLTLVAYYYHPDLDIARARWAQAKGGVTTASRRPNPTADTRYQYVSNPEPDTPVSVSESTLFFPIEAIGKRRNRIAQAECLSEAARLNIQHTASDVQTRICVNMINLYEAMHTEALLKQNVAFYEENDRLLQQRLREGELSPLEVTRAHLLLSEARLALAQGQKQRADARVQLANAVGISHTALEGNTLSFDFSENSALNLSPRDLQRRALRGRSDVLAALEEYTASQSALQMELAVRFPDLQLGPGFEWDQGSDKWGLSASVLLPVFNRNEGPVAEARARRDEAAARKATGVRGEGFIDTPNQHIILQTEGQSLTAGELVRSALVAGTDSGAAMNLTLGDVARVTEVPAPPISAASIMGKPGVILNL
jgi:outer membrane protein, heavy metal efflux system